jgi:hypothetical protein
VTFLWLMYAADVAESFSTVFTVALIVSMIAYAAWWIIKGASVIDGDFAVRRPPHTMIAFIGAIALLGSVIPSKQTLYAAAAMSAGKDAAQTVTGQKALVALNAWLDRQSKGDAK